MHIEPHSQDHAQNHLLILSIVVWGCLLPIGQYLPLVADEAYYTAWSTQLALGYFDHPPLVAYLIASFGHNPRLAAWCTSSCALLLLTLGAKAISPRKWKALPPLFILTPFGLAGGLLMTPDIPLLLGLSVAILGLIRRNRGLTCLGLTIGLWSKPFALLMLPAIWFRFRGVHFFQICIGAAIAYSPNLYWSATHSWLPWSFQSGRPYAFGLSSPLWVLEYVGGQCLLVGPLLIWSAWQLFTTSKSEENRIWTFLSLPCALVVGVMSLGLHVEANWGLMIWPPVLLYATTSTELSKSPMSALQRRYGFLCAGLLGFVTFLHDQVPMNMGPERDGEALSACIESQFPNRSVLAVRYQDLSLLRQTRTKPVLLKTETHRASQYHLWDHPNRRHVVCNDLIIGESMLCPQARILHQGCQSIITECICQP